MYMLEIYYDSGNEPMHNSLVKRLKSAEGCLSVVDSIEGISNKIVATFIIEAQAEFNLREISKSSLAIFPKFKILVENTGTDFL